MDAGDASIGQSPRGVTLSYSNGLLTTVQDPQGRTLWTALGSTARV